MSTAFPFQLVGFLDKEPSIGEPVYYGVNGWYPQIALKRRFNIENMSKEELLKTIEAFCTAAAPFQVIVGQAARTDKMPVEVLEVEPTEDLMAFHRSFIAALGDGLSSRFPEREDGYYPHITAEYNNKPVINKDLYADRTFVVDKVWLLKDVDGENSQAYAYFTLGGNKD